MRRHLTPLSAIALENEIPQEAFVFLGGTCNNSKWRDKLIEMLHIPYFDPRVNEGEWNNNCAKQEEAAKVKATIIVYAITPKQHGYFSLVEMAVSACLVKNKRIYIAFLNEDEEYEFTDRQLSSNQAIKELLTNVSNAEFFNTLEDRAASINTNV